MSRQRSDLAVVGPGSRHASDRLGAQLSEKGVQVELTVREICGLQSCTVMQSGAIEATGAPVTY